MEQAWLRKCLQKALLFLHILPKVAIDIILIFALDYKQGWEQYDTQSDAWYFGIWVNTKTMQVLEYCEGDVILRTYYHKYGLKEALDKMTEFHGEPPPAFTSIDEKGDICHFYDERPSIT